MRMVSDGGSISEECQRLGQRSVFRFWTKDKRGMPFVTWWVLNGSQVFDYDECPTTLSGGGLQG